MTSAINNPGKSRGFTFVELMMVVAIIAVLAGISIPAFRAHFEEQVRQDFASRLQTAMQYQRERAVTEGEVTVCALDDAGREVAFFVNGTQTRVSAMAVPSGIEARVVKPQEASGTQVAFYPDGQIEPATIELRSRDGAVTRLTTEEQFGQVTVRR